MTQTKGTFLFGQSARNIVITESDSWEKFSESARSDQTEKTGGGLKIFTLKSKYKNDPEIKTRTFLITSITPAQNAKGKLDGKKFVFTADEIEIMEFGWRHLESGSGEITFD